MSGLTFHYVVLTYEKFHFFTYVNNIAYNFNNYTVVVRLTMLLESVCLGISILTIHRKQIQKNIENVSIPYGLTARIAGFHPAGPGSTPGMGNLFSFVLIQQKNIIS